MFLRQNGSAKPVSPVPADGEPPVLQRPGAGAAAAAPRPVEPVPQPNGEPRSPSVSPPPVVVAPVSSSPAPSEDGSGKRLIVGDGIRLKGEITACDRLVVEGHVEVTLNETRALEIRPSGRFIGSCEVEEAEISGTYEGELAVRGRLVIRASGKISAKIRYGELELERGGRISGELTVQEPAGPGSSAPAPRKP